MSYARGSQRGLKFIAETVVGTTPDTDVTAMDVLRNTGDSLTLTKDSFVSSELRNDRATTEVTMGNKQTGGGIDFELSADNFDALLLGALYADTTDFETGVSNGTTERSYTIEKSFPNIPLYQIFNGVHINTLSLNVQGNSVITGSIDTIGMGYASQASTIEGTAGTTSPISGGLFDSYNLKLREGGSLVSDELAVALSMTLNLNNNLTPAFVLGSSEAQEVIDGRCSVDGSLQVYFENASLFDKFKNDEESSIELDLITTRGASTITYTIALPRVKYTSADNPVSDEGALNVAMNFTALQDDVAGHTIKITKVVV